MWGCIYYFKEWAERGITLHKVVWKVLFHKRVFEQRPEWNEVCSHPGTGSRICYTKTDSDLKIKGTWKTTDARRHTDLSFFFLKAGEKFPIWKMSPLYDEESNIFLTLGEGLRPGEICTNKPCKLTLIFLVTFPQLTILAPASLPCCVFSSLRFVQLSTEVFNSNCFFGSSFP